MRLLAPEAFDALPPEAEPDLSTYRRLLEAVDAKAAAIEARSPEVFACRPGCHHCCRAVPTVLPVEWANLREHDRGGDGIALRSELHPGEVLCRRLEGDGRCAIYPVRPVVCRTHGHLLLSEDGLDACPWNWQGVEEVEEGDLFRLEDLHGSLVRVNLAFLRQAFPTRWRDLADVRIVFHPL